MARVLIPDTAAFALPEAADFFQLFNFPRRFELDGDELTARYRALQQLAHPDRHAGKTEMERALALDMASRVNDAYAVLKSPFRRAVYLLSLNGLDVFAETDTAMPPDFLEEQITWREALAAADDEKRQQVAADILRARDAAAAETARLLSAAEWRTAYDVVRRWRYLEKLSDEARQ